jgi:hypothetical protein
VTVLRALRDAADHLIDELVAWADRTAEQLVENVERLNDEDEDQERAA